MAGLRSHDAMPGGPPPPLSERNQSVTPPSEIMQRRNRRQKEREAAQEQRLREERERQLQQQQQQQQEEQRRAQQQAEQVQARQEEEEKARIRREQAVGLGATSGDITRLSVSAPYDRTPLGNVGSTDARNNGRNITEPRASQPRTQELAQSHRRAVSEAQTQATGPPASRPRASSTQNAQAPTTGSRRTEPVPENKKRTTSSFPHAFERWETLSSHWEGLTGYWIKRLQNNDEELRGQPVSQQLARQVTDLSAAGANLFHAVVELQRLRASSERKFQRWFIETRADQEKQIEENSKLKAQLKAQLRGVRDEPRQETATNTRDMQVHQERFERQSREAQEKVRQAEERSRASEEASRIEVERVRQQAEKQLSEMRRELQISRDEARRGWEEIGRMEQSERDRMFSLRSGQATLVGNIQVVPMARQAMISSRPTTREGGLSSHPVQPEDIQYPAYPGDTRSETDTDPFTENGGRNATGSQVTSRIAGLMPESQPQTTYPTSAAAVEASTGALAVSPGRAPRSTGAASPHSQPSSTQATFPPRSESMPAPRQGPTSAPGSAGFYQQGQSVLRQQPGQSQPQVLQAEEVRSYGSGSEADYAYEQPERVAQEAHGRAPANPERIRSPSEASEDYGTTIGAQSGFTHPTSNGNSHGVSAPDYSGAGYGVQEWGAVLPRHHHPTRLSDVPEVDEWSRTSPSRASERSRGFR